jgi:hypothetical protein
MENMNAAIARLKMHFFIGIVFRNGFREYVTEGDAEASDQRAERLSHFANDGGHRIGSLTKRCAAGKSAQNRWISQQ